MYLNKIQKMINLTQASKANKIILEMLDMSSSMGNAILSQTMLNLSCYNGFNRKNYSDGRNGGKSIRIEREKKSAFCSKRRGI